MKVFKTLLGNRKKSFNYFKFKLSILSRPLPKFQTTKHRKASEPLINLPSKLRSDQVINEWELSRVLEWSEGRGRGTLLEKATSVKRVSHNLEKGERRLPKTLSDIKMKGNQAGQFIVRETLALGNLRRMSFCSRFALVSPVGFAGKQMHNCTTIQWNYFKSIPYSTLKL